MHASKRKFLLIGPALLLLAYSVGLSAVSAGDDTRISADKDRIAIQGYDTVSYFDPGKPLKGLPEHAFEWGGARWLFSSARNRDLFLKNPDGYAPRFGGFCTGGLALGVKVKADPQNWVIVDGRLYLSADKLGVEDLADMPATISKAQGTWNALSQ